jgi:large subunit ribosomal protein L25
MSQDKVALELTKRETVGKGLGSLRREGLVPGVIHDHGKDSVVVQGEFNQVTKTFLRAGKHHIVALNVAGTSYNALIKDVSRDPRKNTITHIVFNAVKANEKVDAEIPVKIQFAEGNDATPAERAGLIVLHNTETVAVEAFPKDLPDELYFDGEALVEAGDQATVGDLIIPSGVVVKEEPGVVLATVFEPSALAAANEDAGGDAQPGDEAEVESEEGGEASAESPAAEGESTEKKE